MNKELLLTELCAHFGIVSATLATLAEALEELEEYRKDITAKTRARDVLIAEVNTLQKELRAIDEEMEQLEKWEREIIACDLTNTNRSI